MIDIQALARETMMTESRQVDNLVAAAVLHYGVVDPAELVVCRQISLNGGIRIWVEPMTTRVIDTRVAALNEENAVLRARVQELEQAALRVVAIAPYGEAPEVVDSWERLREVLGE